MSASTQQVQVSGIFSNEVLEQILEDCIKDFPINATNGKVAPCHEAFILVGPDFSDLFEDCFHRVGVQEYSANWRVQNGRLKVKTPLAQFRHHPKLLFDINLTLEIKPGWRWTDPMWRAYPRSIIDEDILEAICKPFKLLTHVQEPVIEITLYHTNDTYGAIRLAKEKRARNAIADALEETLQGLPQVREYYIRVEQLERHVRYGKRASLATTGDDMAHDSDTESDESSNEDDHGTQMRGTGTDAGEEGDEERVDWLSSARNRKRFMRKMEIKECEESIWDGDDEDDGVCITMRKFRKYVLRSLTERDRKDFLRRYGEQGGQHEWQSDEEDTVGGDKVKKLRKKPVMFEWSQGYVRLEYFK